LFQYIFGWQVQANIVPILLCWGLVAPLFKWLGCVLMSWYRAGPLYSPSYIKEKAWPVSVQVYPSALVLGLNYASLLIAGLSCVNGRGASLLGS
tara:strand:- start:7122 stop:7403 length:282 start_codon:yes stop_codon:yes gene_type:complete